MPPDGLAWCGAGPPSEIRVEGWDGSGEPPNYGRGIALWAPLPWFSGAYYEGTGTWSTALAALPDVEVVQLLTSGYEHALPHIDPAVTVCNAHGVHDGAVAEWVVGLLLATLRHVPGHVRAHQRREALRLPSEDLAGKRILIYGWGAIGKVVESRLVPFGVEIQRVGRHPRDGVHDPVTIEPHLPSVDVVVLLVPLTPETRGLVDAAFLAKLHDGCLVMNPSRGAVVELPALVAEVGAGRLRAVLDVTDPEPLPPDHPAYDVPNLVLTSRSAGRTDGVWSRAMPLVAQQLRRLARGEALANVVRAGRP